MIQIGGGREEHKKSQVIRYEMIGPDLKCALKHNNPLSTRYIASKSNDENSTTASIKFFKFPLSKLNDL
jgi:hypothetical protein